MGVSRKLKGGQVLRAPVPEMKGAWCSALGLGRLSPTGSPGAHSQRPPTQVLSQLLPLSRRREEIDQQLLSSQLPRENKHQRL